MQPQQHASQLLCGCVRRMHIIAPAHAAHFVFAAVGIVVDAGPMIATFLVDGLVCDGGHAGPKWAAGWAWLPAIKSLEGSTTMAVGKSVTKGFIYERALLNSELVASSRVLLG